MIRKTAEITGKMAFILGWPILYLYLSRSKRTRVMVVVDNEVLAVRGWIGDGGWSLPGGGLHRSETPKSSAVRELKEETGIEVNETELQLLIDDKSIRRHGMSFRIVAYAVILKQKPVLSRQKLEINELDWLNINELEQIAKDRNYTDVASVLGAFNKQ